MEWKEMQQNSGANEPIEHVPLAAEAEHAVAGSKEKKKSNCHLELLLQQWDKAESGVCRLGFLHKATGFNCKVRR
jgi:hypothetical protein